MPRAEQGAWRETVQLVWNGTTSRLERRRYDIFDPFSEAGFDIAWEPRRVSTDRAGPITGSGVLTWRRAGALRFGAEHIMAQYRGEMAQGRPHGRGIFLDRSGLRYDGEWSNGLMEGEGHLLLPNGDVYRGGFKAGRLHGHGVYIDAAGRTHDGGFFAGLRDGPAQVAEPNGLVYASVWIRGVEDQLRRGPAAEDWARLHRVQVPGATASNLAMTLSLGGPAQFCCFPGPPSFGYASTSLPDRIEIFPDAPRLLDVWRGRANIVIEDADLFDWHRATAEEYSLLNYSSKYNKTVPLQFGLENRSAKPAVIVGGYLDVVRSQVDLQPALQSIELTPRAGQSIEFSIENYGWSPARSARLNFRFHNRAKNLQTDPIQLPIGDITEIGQFSFAPALTRFGVRVKELPSVRDACMGSDASPCIRKLIGTGVFGRLSDYVVVEGKGFGFRAVGQLSYDWRDADGQSQTTTTPFDALVPLGAFRSLAECEGGDFNDLDLGRPFELAEDRRGYRIPLPLKTTVGAGTVSRWRMTLDAAKSSRHEFRVVLQLADGQQMESRKISLLLFRPNTYPTSVRPLEGRC
jgi:hypothetical protein